MTLADNAHERLATRPGRLGIANAAASRDYLERRREFQLHGLLTEQRHPRTRRLSREVAGDVEAGLASLLDVDEDVAAALAAIAADPARLALLERALAAICSALRAGRRVYVYGTGSTGRLAATLESALWRPFWSRLADTALGDKVATALPTIGARVRGEITGADRALISSLEGFEDLPLIGRLQLEDNAIGPGDVVFAVTEGGETSAVIGTALAAAAQPGRSADEVWFVHNNPPAVLRPLARSRAVLDHPGIVALALPTGPQAIAGSTRMQATTTSLYVLGTLLEAAACALLADHVDAPLLRDAGVPTAIDLATRLRRFATLQQATRAAAAVLAPWTRREAATYAASHCACYLAGRALMPVFVDVTERAPTFRLAPLDTVAADPPRSWISVRAPVEDADAAWQALLQRRFHGLAQTRFGAAFANDLDDAYLQAAALRGLALAGQAQARLYDLSLAAQPVLRGGDLAVLVLLGDERTDAATRRWLEAARDAGVQVVLVTVGAAASAHQDIAADERVAIPLPDGADPLWLEQIIALKMLLNAHSSAVMARLGRVVGNTMTAVQPGNLKLIGRATHLIQMHVNAVLDSPRWRVRHGNVAALEYAEANAALFAALEWREQQHAEATEVELAVVAILDALGSAAGLDWPGAQARLRAQRLDDLLADWLD